MKLERWTPEREADLLRLRAAGLTRPQIAARMGLSLNAIIGKLFRLERNEWRRVNGDMPKPKAEKRPPKPRRATTYRTNARVFGAEPAPPATGKQKQPPKQGLCRLTDTPGRERCRFPIGHPDQPDFRFCGDRAEAGKPYCANHCAVCYQRRPAEAAA